MFPTLQGGSSSFLQGSSPTIQGSSPQLQSAPTAAQTLQPAVSPIGASYAPSNNYSPPVQTSFTDKYGNTFNSAAGASGSNTQHAGWQASNDASRDAIIGGGQSSNAINAANYRTGASNLSQQIGDQQTGINSSRENVEAGRLISMDDLVNGVRAGLQGGGIQLANSNGLDSSAAEALSRAWTNYGGQQSNKINNQAAMGQHTQDIAQQSLGRSKDTGLQNLKSQRDTYVASVSGDVSNKLNILNQTASSQGLNPYDVAGLRQQIIDEGTQKLGEVDNWLSGQLGGYTAENQDQVNQNAYKLRSSGGAAPNAYSYEYSTQPGVSAQNPLADVSQLPLFVRPRTQV